MLLTPSMPLTLASSHHNALFPPMKEYHDVGRSFECYGRSPRGEEITKSLLPHRQEVTPATIDTKHPSNDGINGANGHTGPLPVPVQRRLSGVHTVASNTPPHPTTRGTINSHLRQQGGPEPFYKSYYSARQRSPIVKKEPEPSSQIVSQRRSSNDVNTIASHFQIPSSINNSKGSLPEFAAQITCLFWFDGSSLSFVDDSQLSSPIPRDPLPPEAIPTTGFRKWVTTILSMTQVSQNVILLALMFIHRLKKYNPGVKGKVGSEFRLLTVALMLGNKFLDDNTYTNKTWADVSGISVGEIHVMEVEFLSNMRYSLYASKAEWEEWHIKLGKFAEYYERAQQIPPVSPSRSIILPNPRFSGAPNLPSPPVSQHSPLYISQTSPPSQGLAHPHSLPPYLPSTSAVVSSSGGMPLNDARVWSRKRSVEDSSIEPPAAKRTTSSISPFSPSSSGTNSSATLTPSTIVSTASMNTSLTPTTRDYASPWKLPPPQALAGHIPVSHTPTGQMPLQMPAGRAMASVFSNSNRSAQRGQLPSLQLPHQHNLQSVSASGTPTEQTFPNNTPYSQVSTPSPTAYHFPQHQTPTGLSPSGFPAPRNSPYKPVRRVSTLLVPPPTTSVQQAPQRVSYDQMRYQPLGRPNSERRTGVLPVHPFYTWSDNAHQLQHQLPPPSFLA